MYMFRHVKKFVPTDQPWGQIGTCRCKYDFDTFIEAKGFLWAVADMRLSDKKGRLSSQQTILLINFQTAEDGDAQMHSLDEIRDWIEHDKENVWKEGLVRNDTPIIIGGDTNIDLNPNPKDAAKKYQRGGEPGDEGSYHLPTPTISDSALVEGAQEEFVHNTEGLKELLCAVEAWTPAGNDSLPLADTWNAEENWFANKNRLKYALYDLTVVTSRRRITDKIRKGTNLSVKGGSSEYQHGTLRAYMNSWTVRGQVRKRETSGYVGTLEKLERSRVPID